MDRLPITLDEKVDARFTRLNKSACWMWEGSLNHGRPAINQQHVLRYIFERERGPIPEGHTLWRTDHSPGCQRGKRCRHRLCVNPWHLEVRPIPNGAYEREQSGWLTDTGQEREPFTRATARKRHT